MDLFTEQNNLLEKGKENTALRIKMDFITDKTILVIDTKLVYTSLNGKMEFYNTYSSSKNRFKDFSINAMVSLENDRVMYDEIRFDPSISTSALDLEDLILTTKSLKSIITKLNKIREKEGSPRDFYDYLIRLGRVLKIGGFYLSSDTKQDVFYPGIRDLPQVLTAEYNKMTNHQVVSL
ncbi:hypothetical protein V6259_17970 [Marinomonas sp. TI.3.20]|uniref:hypothetical protein n=1 Tax=Marinomonas sp. TI.3.20 TaxID=3121296 RepID=UPI0031203D21